MKVIFDFIKNNLAAVVIGLFCFIAYLYFAYSGNRICDCETTEKYSTSGNRSSVNRFYHK
ncbi:hypothetical protein LNQ49_11235 [Flavobacterium sp. F-65]|jgi:hypothetical protein|uniref:Virus attachment protein p12 family protein n=1 Tax=Flavobacterium pisciphilum TaxID=2893755 RepID=A0ABS8MTQ9_9FLAO|nr:hypothetical protein [Flavobacterium sp. F-65]MCC9072154.1 hypothetical protein [Flavobacterium sp. F-65]